MIKNRTQTTIVLVFFLGCATNAATATAAVPLTSAISYQGRLKDAGAPANGEYDMRFSLFDAASAGGTIAGPLVFDGVGGNPPPVAVTSGLFQVELDFGSAFNGAALWLSIQVRPHGAGVYTTLSPRQPLTAAPIALYALDGPGQAGFWQANGNSIHKTNSGNVGIGATDPQANLEVRSATFPRLRVAKLFSGGFGVASPAVLELKSNFVGSDQPYGRVNFLDGNDTVRGSIEYGNAPGLAPVSLRLGTAGQTRVSITDAGNVGIGTGSPSHPLDVVGRARIQQAPGGNTAGLWLNQRGPNEDRAFIGMANDQEVGFYGTEGAGWGLVMGVGNGNVGIGQTSPAAKLHINGGTDTSLGSGGFIVMGSTNGANISMDNNEIMARDGGVAAPLHLNANGGDVVIGGALDINIQLVSHQVFDETFVSVSCPAGMIIIGGGCAIGGTGEDGLKLSKPSNDLSTWYCASSYHAFDDPDEFTAYAICAGVK